MPVNVVNKVMSSVASLLLAWGLAWPITAIADADWPQFRGTDQDGVSRETDWNPRALANGAKVLWSAEVGAGYSSVSIQGDRLFTAGNRENQDVVVALSVRTGEVLWEYRYPCPGGSYPGPRATPATDGKAVYMFSREGLVLCLDAATGAVKWQTNLMREFGAGNLKWGFSGSPVIRNDKLIINAGEYGVVLDRHSGAKRWASPAGTGGYATPVVVRDGKGDSIVLFGEKALYIVDLETGRQAGSYPWETRYDVNAADPIVRDGRIFISSGYGKGCVLLESKGPALRRV